MKCLEKDRTRRYETVNGLARDIERYLASEPIMARPPSKLYRFQKLVLRNLLPFIAASAMVTALAVGLGVSLWLLHREQAAHRLAHDAEQKAESNLWEARLAQARVLRGGSQPGRRFDGLDAVAQAAAVRPSPELRNEAIALLALTDMRVGKRVARPAVFQTVSAITPDFHHYALVDDDGNISLRRFLDETEAALLPGFGFHGGLLKFNADGRFLVCRYDDPSHVGQNVVQVWDLERRVATLKLTNAMVASALDWHPREALLAVGSDRGAICLYDVRSSQQVQRLDVDLSPQAIRLSPQGDRLAVSSSFKAVVLVFDLEDRTLLQSLRHEAGVWALAWHAGGELLATGCEDHRVYLWDVLKGELLGHLYGQTALVAELAFSADGDLLASAGWDSMFCLWDPLRRERLARVPGKCLSLQFDSSARQLGLFDGGNSLNVFDITQGSLCRDLIRGTNTTVHSAVFTADGRVLASLSILAGCFRRNPRISSVFRGPNAKGLHYIF